MRVNPISQSKRLAAGNCRSCLSLLALVTLLLAGCAEKQIRVHPWQASIYARPNIPVPAPGYQPRYLEASAPDLQWDFPPPPSRLSLIRQPARPHVSTQQQQPETADPRQPTAPSLAPQLSPQEIVAAQTQMNESVAIAQKHLEAAKGRTLSAAQSDLASKIVSFLQESKDAARDGDWMRAKNLAKKAQVLSEELGASL